ACGLNREIGGIWAVCKLFTSIEIPFLREKEC
ncbi:unnamed protein product, partial [marine sediment metagenome]